MKGETSQVLKITQIKSSLRREKSQGLTLRALGLRKRHQTVLHKDTPEIRGMIKKVQHLVKVEVEEK
ncbi:MAG: 50S ribosomal protein L30 [Candidatus Eisenbacteria bacterium]|nr:50S ribosomal protein L30 [Candidatus Eisenbacteria bacterium]